MHFKDLVQDFHPYSFHAHNFFPISRQQHLNVAIWCIISGPPWHMWHYSIDFCRTFSNSCYRYGIPELLCHLECMSCTNALCERPSAGRHIQVCPVQAANPGWFSPPSRLGVQRLQQLQMSPFSSWYSWSLGLLERSHVEHRSMHSTISHIPSQKTLHTLPLRTEWHERDREQLEQEH